MPTFQNEWPSGNYGLPKPRTGCPNRSWREGFRYQDSENLENTNSKSNKSHLSGNVTQHGIRQEFCIHMNTRNEQIPWPRGKYCIYKKGGTCPVGLHEGMFKDAIKKHFSIPKTIPPKKVKKLKVYSTDNRLCLNPY